ncbi:MAG: type II toxin-antitoxin system VapB family antitoxin [Gammaproteobacteria bacterium]|nr:type II toxin-antitoxin system VapB family antitoxin [Gammaproteobacteria bacterium]
MQQGSVFKSNRSQAVRLPKAVAFSDAVKRVDIVVVGRSRLLSPAGEIWDNWFDSPGVSEDFMVERDQPADQERNAL